MKQQVTLSPGGVSLFMVFILTTTVSSNPDSITFLPGLQKQPSFNQYSGYLTANNNRQLHYWFVESQSNPKTDPLILWTNGGPGCSSMLGILSENGPFLVESSGSTLVYNDNSWNKFANVLYLESPAGVGFSYAPDKNVTTNDDQITGDHITALQNFYKIYSSFKMNKLFLIGESYSGVYTPLLASKVFDEIDNGSLINFGGFAIGNGVTSYKLKANSVIYFAYNHGIIGDELWKALNQYCCNSTECNFYDSKNQNCSYYVEQSLEIINSIGINPYNILADCAGGIPTLGKPGRDGYYNYSPDLDHFYKGTTFGLKMRKVYQQLPTHKLKATVPCLDFTDVTTYLKSPFVRQALHISNSSLEWQPCSADVGSKYTSIYDDLSSQYIKAFPYKVSILVYNGDLDTRCDFLGNQWFVEGLGAESEVQWRPWIYSDGSNQVAGFVREYQNIAFATVKGAGHMAPQDKPIATALLIKNFVYEKPY